MHHKVTCNVFDKRHDIRFNESVMGELVSAWAEINEVFSKLLWS